MREKIKTLGIILLSLFILAGCQKVTADVMDEEEIELAEQVEKNQDTGANDLYADTNSLDTENALVDDSQEATSDTLLVEETEQYDFTLAFAGDINFDESWSNMIYYKQQENGIYDCISEELIEEMQRVDLMWINNEFTYSEKGERLEGKAYCFRANPDRVEILSQLGVDIAGLANNHVFDYGEISFIDTLLTLEEEGIAYVGAGKNLEEAMDPIYFEVDGKTIAYVAASRAEKYKMTPQAGEDSPGILRCYDPNLFIEEIKEADQNADFVIACVHWGTEHSTVLEEEQLTTGRMYLEAGADAVIGAHTHCLQGFEFVDGKAIVYSLGNFWFNDEEGQTMLLELHFTGDSDESEITLQVIPAIQDGGQTIYAKEDEAETIYSQLEDISINASIDENGFVTEK